MKLRIIYLTALMFMASACESAFVEPDAQYGEITVGLSELSVDVSTRAAGDGYRLNLVNPADSEQNRETTIEEGYKESFVVRYGSYNIYAEDCSVEEAADGYGCRRIAGMAENIVLSDAKPLQEINIACSVANAQVIVNFEDTVKDLFEGLKVNLNTPGRSLDIPQTSLNTNIVTWFNPTEYFTYTVKGTYVGEEGGDSKPIEKSYSRELKAKDCIRITVRFVVPSGDLLPDLDFDVDIISTETSSGSFNPYI